MRLHGFGKIRNTSVIFAAFAAVLAAGAGVAYAAASNVEVSGTTDHTVYKTGQTVTITGTVNGDIFCAGQTIDVDADVNGDVICAGQTVTVDGEVHGDVRLAGETVNLGAQVDHNATILAQTAILQSNAMIAGDVGVGAQDATLDGQVGRDVRATASTLLLGGSVGRNLDANVNKFEVGSRSFVGGNVTYTSPTKTHAPDGATVDGTVTYHHRAPQDNGKHVMWRGIGIFAHLYTIVTLLVFGLVLVALFPRMFESWNRRASSRFWMTLFTGFIAMFAVPLLIIALLISVIGAPIAIFVGLLWIIAIFLSAPLSAYYVGRLIMGRERRSPLVILVGSLVLGLVTLIPVLGWVLSLFALWFGTGSVLVNLKYVHKQPPQAVIE